MSALDFGDATSFAGMTTFNANLNRLMESKTFKEADEVQKLQLGGLLLRSKYGIGSFCGFGPVHKLPEQEESNVELGDRR